MKPATDSDLIPAIPIWSRPPLMGDAVARPLGGGAAFCSSWGTMGGGADASRESVDATCTRDPAPQVRVWRDRASDCPIDWHRAQHGGAHRRARGGCQAFLAGASNADGPSVGSDAVCQRWRAAGLASQSRTGLDACPSRTPPSRRHTDAAMGRISGVRAGWLSLQPLVRSVPGLGGPPVADNATEPSRWRAYVRRLCWPDG